jgi:branched-chain amino acid transport system permease protein
MFLGRDMSASFEILLQTLLSGVLIGLIYALVAVGLTLIFGVMDIVNFAHGEFLMLGMYASFWGFSLWALDPIFTLPLTALMLFALGASIYHLVIRRAGAVFLDAEFSYSRAQHR